MADRGFIIGLGSLLNKDLSRTDIDIAKLEESIAGLSLGPIVDPVQKYTEEMEAMKEATSPILTPAGYTPLAEHTPAPPPPADTQFSPLYKSRPAPAQSTHGSAHPDDAPAQPSHSAYETRERAQFEQIERVTRDIFGTDTEGISFDNDRRETDRIYMIEEITILKQELEDINIDVSPYVVHDNMTYEDVKKVHARIKWRHSTEEYGTLVGQIITAGARVCESVFDGKRVWFNRYKPDLTDWSQTLHPNIRNIRSRASRAMGQVMQGNSMSLDLAIRFIPGMLMQMDKNSRKKQNNLQFEANEKRNTLSSLRTPAQE